MPEDPFPNQLLLDKSEVRQMMGMEKTTFERWLRSPAAAHFPRPVEIGKTEKGLPILKWKKARVLAFIDLLGGQ